MHSIAPNIKVYGARPEMCDVNTVVVSVFAKYNVDCTVTSVTGGTHRKRSLHPVGFAKDYRSHHLTRDLKHKILKELRKALPQCDVLLEYEGKPKEHFHVEFDPKDDPEFQEHKLWYQKHGKWPD